ncbi:MAG: SulP family inorganic anion transporter [Lentisphaeria bacterium]|jgi:SulP family sulfate permease
MKKRMFWLPSWLSGYNKQDLRGDAQAGLIVAVMLVPQAMAYAMLAGLPPVYGLCAATLPLLAYALLGTSRQLAVGPVAIVSLLTAEACSRLVEDGADVATVAGVAALLALLVGAIQIALGLCRAGFLVNFVSHAVVSGFTSAGAIMIGLSQLPQLLGVKTSGGNSAVALLMELLRKAGEVHGLTLAIGLTATAVLLLARFRRWRFPVTLPVIAASILLVWWFDLEAQGVRAVGTVAGGLPRWRPPVLSLESLGALLPSALVIVFIGVMESIAVAKWIATREKYRIDANRELLGLGLANVVAGLFSGYPVAGGFSRTAVNYQAGARTPLAAVFTAALVLLTMLFLTPLFTHLPNAVLAAIIMSAVIGLIDFQEARRLFTVKKADGWIFVVTFLVTLGLGMDKGLIAGIIFSLVLFIQRSARPNLAVLGRVGEHEFRDLRRYPDAAVDPAVVILRVDSSLYFANAGFVEEWIRTKLVRQPSARWVVLDMSGVNDIDAVAVSMLSDLMRDTEATGVQFLFCGMKAAVRDITERAGWKELLGEQMYQVTLAQALATLELERDRKA